MPDQPAHQCTSQAAHQGVLPSMTSATQPARKCTSQTTHQSARSRIVLRAIRVHTTGRQYESNGHDRDTNSSISNVHGFLAFCFGELAKSMQLLSHSFTLFAPSCLSAYTPKQLSTERVVYLRLSFMHLMTSGSTGGLACCAASMSCWLNLELVSLIMAMILSALTPELAASLMSSTVSGG